MKTILFRSVCFLAACLALSGCEKKLGDGVTLKDIAVGEGIRVNIGETGRLYAYPVPYDCTDYEFKWESADPGIATVDEFGRVASVDVGNTTVYVSQGSIRKEFAVEVYEVTLQEKLNSLGVKGLWQFEDAGNLFKATVGNDLTPVGSGFTQGEGQNRRKKAAILPSSEKIDDVWHHNHLICNHGLAPNGGGKKVNEFTVIVDCMFPGGPTNAGNNWQNGKYYCLYQTAMNNTSDGDFFWRPSANFGVTGSYSKQEHLFVKDTWYRFAIVVNLGKSIKYFMNGQYYEAGNSGELDGDRAWLPEGVLLFADEDGENGQGFPLYVSTVGIFDRALSDDEVKSLGGI
ncbi:MAG: Ig-like domain-containing protein [Tannerella sp.]|jgi:hypothetical protein|nr:Ig-like domain-containing protein [Tannerella sp.]